MSQSPRDVSKVLCLNQCFGDQEGTKPQMLESGVSSAPGQVGTEAKEGQDRADAETLASGPGWVEHGCACSLGPSNGIPVAAPPDNAPH